MTPEQRALARHALGLDGKRRVSYRNRYVTGPGDAAYAEWSAMVEQGLAEKRDGSTIPDLFWLKLEGAVLALLPGERLDPEDFPS